MKLYNTLTRQLDDFTPIHKQKVTLYTCGPTVYDYPHVGNWSGYIYWDILVRTLQANNYRVDRVMNITDVGHLVSDADDGEDKLEKGAKREGKTAWEVADFYTKDFIQGIDTLNLIRPTHITKATNFIEEQISLVKKLEEKGYTYIINDGVYFDTSKFETYADFAHLNTEALKAGARVEYNNEKRNPTDFALWKFTPKGQKRDMEWGSPWGNGFPGWHLECSAMAMSLLGETIDIHTGGIDHIPVHHTNEIAQSEAATGVTFSHYWLHNNHLKVNGTKISKSLNNGFTLQDLHEKGFTADDFRMFVLQSHYRTEGNFTWENLIAAKNRLSHWKEVASLRWQLDDTPETQLNTEEVVDALSHDIDTPAALALIDAALDNIAASPRAIVEYFQIIDKLLGFRILDQTQDISGDQKTLIKERRVARDSRDWETSDKIRDKLLSQGIILKDSNTTTLWYRH